MKLTQYDRTAFVAAAMDDVPQIDYSAKARKLWEDTVRAALPADLLNCMKKHDLWFITNRVELPMCLQDFSTRLRAAHHSQKAWRETFPQLALEIDAMAVASKEQSKNREAIEQQLRGAIASCSTLKAAQDMLPEFVKYLPEDRDGDKKCRQMPVIANLVTDMMNAGWPKGKGDAKPAAG